MSVREFVHPILNEEILSISSRYVFEKETRLPYNGKEILYYSGYSVTDGSCCGVGGCVFSYVPGIIIRWHNKKSEDGNPISEIDTIEDESLMKDITSKIKEREHCMQVNFL